MSVCLLCVGGGGPITLQLEHTVVHVYENRSEEFDIQKSLTLVIGPIKVYEGHDGNFTPHTTIQSLKYYISDLPKVKVMIVY